MILSAMILSKIPARPAGPEWFCEPLKKVRMPEISSGAVQNIRLVKKSFKALKV